ncbi:efflux RND transporter periplasmic adaptor subunit [Desertivirga arenae]|uniref:efflux RND transporter periplasmic adaptor subunit n=1 Tax=Desertivirga arenae TaxID=2810309 RepID=UPI001A95C06B|nr:efflux RND transporter periplasmic adaptor subunit [Pedobacter sp. SYSU D00823]
MNKNLRSIFLIVLNLYLVACSSEKSSQHKENKTEYPVVQVSTIDTTLYSEYVADIQAVKNVELRARISGFLERIYVDEGQEVKKGQLLFSLNNTEQNAGVKSAEANLNNALAEAKATSLDLQRVKLLVDKNVLSRSALELAFAKNNASKAKVDDAKASLVHAQARLSYTNIRSPFNGVIDRLPLKSGSLVEEGTLLTSVSDLNAVYAYFNISENEYLSYSRGIKSDPSSKFHKVGLSLADGTLFPGEGKIETSESEFQENTGTIAFRARFNNTHKLLKHGASGKVRLPNILRNAIIIPEKAVLEIQDKNYLFIVDNNNTVKMTPFIPLKRFDDFYIVDSGIKKGDRIVYEGIQNIKDGTRIQPKILTIDSLLIAGH